MKAGEQGTLGQVLSARALLQSQRRSEQAFSMRSHASLIILHRCRGRKTKIGRKSIGRAMDRRDPTLVEEIEDEVRDRLLIVFPSGVTLPMVPRSSDRDRTHRPAPGQRR